MIWEAFREFECAVLAGLQPAPGSVATTDAVKQIDSQTQRIARLFQRQLSVPLIDMDKTLAEYRDWLDSDVDDETIKKYKIAFNKLQQILPFENNLLNSDPPHLLAYYSYLDHETKEGDPVRVLSLYERAVTDNCLETQLWLRYVKYIETVLRSSVDMLVSVYERSLRNCPWSVDLWIGFMLALEQLGQGHQRIVDVFNRALAAGFTQGTEFLRLWTAYLDYLRRRIQWNEEHDVQLNELRVAFEQAISHLNLNYPSDGDPTCSLTQYWAYIEAKYCHQMSKARELWSGILQLGFSSQAAMCLQYVQLERCYGDVKHCRKLFHRLLASVSDWPESVCQQFVEFERQDGDLDSYRDAVHKCEVHLKKVEEKRAKEAEKDAEAAAAKKRSKVDKKRSNKAKNVTPPSNKPQAEPPVRPYNRSRPPPGAPPPTGAPPTGPPPAPDSIQEQAVVYVRGQKRKLADDEMMETTVSSSPAVAAAVETSRVFKAPPPPGYKPKNSTTTSQDPDIAHKKLKVDDGGSEGATDSQSDRSTRPVGGANKDDCTAFISNLDFSVTTEMIEEVFKQIGEINEVRLVTNFKGRSKGYAYVEFKDELAVAAALKLDRQPLVNRPMFVSRCEPGAGGQKFKFNTGLELNKLFIKNLPFSVTKQQLEDLFSPHGTLKEVRLVTFRNGAPKGLAYVDFESESSASQAVLKLDGHVIEGHAISVAISNPPSRGTPAARNVVAMDTSSSTSFVPSLGGGKKQTAEHGKARTQLSLVPRSVNRPNTAVAQSRSRVGDHGGGPDGAATTESGDTTVPPAQAMNNQDFRNMLLR